MTFAKLIVIVGLITIFYSKAEGLRCYQCVGDANSDCAKGVTSAMWNVSCGNVVSECLYSDRFYKGQRRILRLCVPIFKPDMCTRIHQVPNQIVYSCRSCTTDLCNNQTS